VGVIRGLVWVGATAVVVGAAAAVVVGAVVGAWTAGSGFSPHPAAASTVAAARPSARGRHRGHAGAIRLLLLTPGTVTNRLGG
jgi:hypothetical protein